MEAVVTARLRCQYSDRWIAAIPIIAVIYFQDAEEA